MSVRKARHYIALLLLVIIYILAATGPLFLRIIAEYTVTWNIPLIVLIGVSFLIAFFGYFAGRNRTIPD